MVLKACSGPKRPIEEQDLSQCVRAGVWCGAVSIVDGHLRMWSWVTVKL